MISPKPGSPYSIPRSSPNLGIVDVDGSTANNMILPGRNLSVVKDHRDTDPSRRYKGMYWHSHRNKDLPWGGKGHFVPFSADGIHWEPYAVNPAIAFDLALTDGQYVLGWDDRHARYVAYMRPSVECFDPQCRTSAWVSSDDFLHWNPPVLAVWPDEEAGAETEYYRMAVARYQGIYLGFVWVYHNDAEFVDQSRDTMLVFSRDGVSWSRPVGTEAFLKTGEKGEWDSGFAVAHTLLPVGDELWLYYSAGNIPHNIPNADGTRGSVRDWPGQVVDGELRIYAVGLSKLRPDGFVAIEPLTDAGTHADAGTYADAGTVTTVQLTFLGSRLHVNADASQGRVEVELLDKSGNVLPGYERADCQPLSADSTDHVVEWDGRNLVHPTATSADAGSTDWSKFAYQLRQPVRLRFHLNRAKLFSFWLVSRIRG